MVPAEGLAGSFYLIQDMGDAAGMTEGGEVNFRFSDGALTIATPTAATKMQNETDRALILSKFLRYQRSIRDELVGTRVVLRWDTEGAPTRWLSGTIDDRLSTNLMYVRDDKDDLNPIIPDQLVTATLVWTSLGKPDDSEPPRPE